MFGYKMLRPNLYSAELINGKIDLKADHYFSCFFIVNHIDDREFIKKQAIQLLLVGCHNFHFYGDKESVWHLGFDDADIILHPDSAPETVALTSGWNTLEEFTEILHELISLRPIVPHDSYLLYDDDKTYDEVLRKLGL